VPTAPTAVQNIDTDQIATCKFVNLENRRAAAVLLHRWRRRVFTGDPAGPTPPAATDDNDTSIPNDGVGQDGDCGDSSAADDLATERACWRGALGDLSQSRSCGAVSTTLPPNGPAGGI